MRKYDYDEDKLVELVAKSKSFADVARGLGMKAKGGNYETLKRHIVKLGLDTSHFVGRGWSKGLSIPPVDIDEYLSNKRRITPYRLKLRLFSEGLKENRCEVCGIDSWNNKPLNCQLHHLDGNVDNNSLDNLQILCPNCHSQTSNYRGNSSYSK